MKRGHRRWAGVLWAAVALGAVACFTVAVVLELPAEEPVPMPAPVQAKAR